MKPTHFAARAAGRRAQAGLSIVELMVSVAIGLVVALAMFGVLAANESRKRSDVSVNDTNQSGMFASYLIDRAVRNAGSGFAQRWTDIGGCRLSVQRTIPGVVDVWPRADALPAPFESLPAPFNALPLQLRLAPLVVLKDGSAAGSDVLMVMTGSAGFGESPVRLKNGASTAASVAIDNSIGIRGNDLVMVADANDCLLQQVTAGFVGGAIQTVPFAGTFATAGVGSVALENFGDTGNAYAFAIGNGADNPPRFQLFGVGDNDTLFAYDLLNIDGGGTPIPISEGVVELRAVYGVDTNVDGRLDAWVDPGTAPWTAEKLLDGSAASRDNLRRICAVRIGLILRGSLVEKEDVAPASLTLFDDLPAGMEQVRTIASTERNRRYRAVEMTVPVRNLLLRQP